jgi:hypothetical protein
MPAGGITTDRRGYTHRHGPNVLFDLRVSDETWVGVNGTIRDRMLVAGARFASTAGRTAWATYGRPVPNFNRLWLGWMPHDGITVGGDKFPPQPWYRGGEWLGPSRWDVGDSLFSYRQLVSLPSRPAALRAHIQRAEKTLASREARSGRDAARERMDSLVELSDIGGLLASPLLASERLALFHAAITWPGTRVNVHARDSLGRRAVAVSGSAGPAFQRLMFDPATGALLEQAPGIAVVAQGVVDSPDALPKGLSPIRAAGGPPQPLTPAIAPRIGNAMTIFKLRLASPARPGPQPAPALEWVMIGTPGNCFGGFLPRLPPLVTSASVQRTGNLAYVYRLSPMNVHRRTWCPGRYELTVLPTYSRHPQAPPNPDLSPGLGSSVYFRVT